MIGRRPAAVLAQRAGPPERRRRELRPDLRQPRRQLFAPTEDGGYNCAGCHGAEGVGGQARRTRSPTPTGSSSPRSPGRARPSTPCSCASRGGAARHPHLRPARHADAGVGHRGRRSAHRPADRRADRLHRVHPAHDGGGEGGGRAGPAPELGLGDGAEIDWTDPATGEALFNLGLEAGFAGGGVLVRSVPHQGGVVPVRRRRARGRRPQRLRRLPRRHRRLRPGAHQRRRSPASSSTIQALLDFIARGHGVRPALRPARPGHRPHARVRRQPRRRRRPRRRPADDGMFTTDDLLDASRASLGADSSPHRGSALVEELAPPPAEEAGEATEAET